MKPVAGRWGTALARVRFTSSRCRSGDHGACRCGPGHRPGDLPCSCTCHLDAVAADLAYLSTRCKLGEHDDCPGPRGELLAEVAGRRDHVVVPCICDCHGGRQVT